jgi:hypothetical protein
MYTLSLTKFLRFTLIIGAFFSFIFLHGFETKRFDAPPPVQPKYLSSIRPPSLSYGSPVFVVDRRNLILPPSMQPDISASSTDLSNDENKSSAQPEFPLISFEDNSTNFPVLPVVQNSMPMQLPMKAPSQSLPLSDPFDDVSSQQINSTDELLQIFEQSSSTMQNRTTQSLPFIPPYSVAPDSMRVSAKATYKRVRR